MHTRRKAMALVTSAIAAAAGFPTNALAQGKPFRVGFISSTRTILGQQSVTAARVAEKMLNDSGGVLGQRMELVVYDDNSSPVEAASVMQRLIDQDKIKIIVGPYASTQVLAALPIARAEEVLFIPPVSKHAQVTSTGYDKVFRLNSTVQMDGDAFGSYVRNTIKPESIAFVGDNNEVGRNFLEGLKAIYKDAPAKVKSVQFYDNSTTDFSGLITTARASGADTFYVAGTNIEQYGNIYRIAKELGFKPKHQILAPGSLNARMIELAAGGAEGVVSSDIYLPTVDTPINKTFVAAYKAQTSRDPEKLEALWFEAIWILGQAVRKANTTDDLNKIATTIRSNAWAGPRGQTRFDKTGQAASETFIVKVVNGKIQKV